jgi:ABC-2 type transport system ATP-binding protein
VIKQSQLSTWSVRGPDLTSLALELRAAPGVAMVVPFGTTLHVSGVDEALLRSTVDAYRDRPELVWAQAEPNLEDVFIRMMSRAPDNFSDDAQRRDPAVS